MKPTTTLSAINVKNVTAKVDSRRSRDPSESSSSSTSQTSLRKSKATSTAAANVTSFLDTTRAIKVASREPLSAPATTTVNGNGISSATLAISTKLSPSSSKAAHREPSKHYPSTSSFSTATSIRSFIPSAPPIKPATPDAAPSPELSTSPSPKPLPPASSLTLPLSPEVTLHYFRQLLTLYEQSEITAYPEIYFAGSSGPSSATVAAGAVYNYGFDDARGDLYLTHHDHIAYRYEMISLLGKGSFGQCVKCFDHKLKRHVAVKVIRNKKRFEKQGAIEVKVLDRLRDEDKESEHNIVYMHESFLFRGHLCISFEILGINLYEWVKAGGYRGIHTGVLKRFGFQILRSLDLLSQVGIVHCDLKPENILLKDPLTFVPPDFDSASAKYFIKVIDLGSSCYENEKVYTYVQSRFYRSPEVILGIPYTVGIDMWSFGCILAELYTGYPLFPGENEQEQLACIMEVLGTPPSAVLERGTRSKLFFDMTTYAPRIVANSKGRRRRPSSKTLAGLLRTGDAVFVDFLLACLEWSPERRLKPAEALEHEFMRDYWPFGGRRRETAMGAGPMLLSSGRLATTSSMYGRPTAGRGAGLPVVEGKGSSIQRVYGVNGTSSGSKYDTGKKTGSSYRASISGGAVLGQGTLPPISGGHHVTTRVSMYGGLVGNAAGGSGQSVQKRQSLGANLSRSYTVGSRSGRVGAPSSSSSNPWK
ncbi:kinase-like domain-containing protein [Chytriomyces sp. MP71]|nr:kinase-like domain-containing protein [Chytriomyces sp. MP71]